MAIALVITDLDVGGAERALTMLATRLTRNGGGQAYSALAELVGLRSDPTGEYYLRVLGSKPPQPCTSHRPAGNKITLFQSRISPELHVSR